jgi:hypothetical protein
MTRNERCEVGDWVEVRSVYLVPEERSTNLPADTAAQPLTVWVKGFARDAGVIGDQITVETMTGRLVAGALSEVLPGYFHTFGRPIAELVHVGRDLRAQLDAYRAGDAR